MFSWLDVGSFYFVMQILKKVFFRQIKNTKFVHTAIVYSFTFNNYSFFLLNVLTKQIFGKKKKIANSLETKAF